MLNPIASRFAVAVVLAIVALTPNAAIGADSTLVTKARVCPRADIPDRMYGCKIQGSHDGSAWTDLTAGLVAPFPAANAWTDIPITLNTTTAWEYLRWIGGAGSYGNIAELEFYNGATRIEGVKFGTPGSWANAPATNDPRLEFRNAFDGDFATYFDAPMADFAFAGLKIGPHTSRRVREARVRPRQDQAARMIGSTIQGSHDNGIYVDLASITTAPVADGTYTIVPIASTADWEFLRWRGAAGSYGNIADLKFFNAGGEITGIGFGTPGEYDDLDPTTTRTFDKALDDDVTSFFDAPVGAAPGPYVGIEVTGGPLDSVGVAPAITSTAPTTAVVGVLYTYTIATTGTPAPTLTVGGNPSWLTLSGNVLSGTPTALDVGTTGTITVTANGTAPDDTEVFTISVTDTVLPPPVATRSGPKRGCGLGSGFAIILLGLGLGLTGRRRH